MTDQFNRKVQLIVTPKTGSTVLDLSNMHIRFQVNQADQESPNNAAIRVFNLSDDTVKAIRGEYSGVLLNAGYEGNLGTVFKGQLKQFRIGRGPATDSFIDLLCADGDFFYNWSIVNKTVSPGPSLKEMMASTARDMTGNPPNVVLNGDTLGGVLPRGKVYYAMGRAVMRDFAKTAGADWSIQNGRVQMVQKATYLPGEIVDLNARTGMIGFPEQTEEGIRARCLLNPKIIVGSRVRIDNRSINQTVNQDPRNLVPYNLWRGMQFLARIDSDGIYRVFVAEHVGDTRGQDWYTDLICLSVHPTAPAGQQVVVG